MTELRLASPADSRSSLLLGWLVAAVLIVFTAFFLLTQPLEPAQRIVAAAAALLGAVVMGRASLRLRGIDATPAGLHLSGGLGRDAVDVPWSRVRQMRCSDGMGGASWVVRYETVDGSAASVGILNLGIGGGREVPPRVEQVRAAWSAAAGPVSARRSMGTWILSPVRA